MAGFQDQTSLQRVTSCYWSRFNYFIHHNLKAWSLVSYPFVNLGFEGVNYDRRTITLFCQTRCTTPRKVDLEQQQQNCVHTNIWYSPEPKQQTECFSTIASACMQQAPDPFSQLPRLSALPSSPLPTPLSFITKQHLFQDVLLLSFNF